jgi:Ca-activated chloride channel family protein
MRLAWPLALLALLLVPLAVLGYLALERRRARYAIHYTNIEVLASVAGGTRRWRSLIPPVLALLALTCATAALARPEVRVSVPSEKASIALVLDVSGSMSAEDVKPTRLAAAQEAVRRFLDKVPDKYRVGLVTFSSEPYVASPLTRDHQLVLEGLLYGTTFGQGTAIGDALARSVELLQPVTADADGATPAPASSGAPLPVPGDPGGPLSAILLLSDGAQTRGTLGPLEGADRARSYGIPIYTVALGTATGSINRGGFSRPVPPDPLTLKQIARRTGGEFFEIGNASRLNAVYEDLASRLGQKKEWRELSAILLGAAALLALGAGALSLLWVQRLP